MNRAFYYGDLIFETLKVEGGTVQFADLHFARLLRGASVLKFKLPVHFKFESFLNEILHGVARYEFFNSAAPVYRVRYTLYRNAHGFYLPHQHNVLTDIQVNPFTAQPLSPLSCSIYPMQQKMSGPLANLKSGNALLFVMAAIWAKEHGFDDALILNEHGRPVEATSSNLFWKKNEVTYTPPLSEGCVAGIMRGVYMQAQPVQEKPCTIGELKSADVVYLTNALQGVREVRVEG